MTSLQVRTGPVWISSKWISRGGEKAALEGAKALIDKNPRLQLIIEFHPGNIATAGVNPESFFATLMELGFKKFHAIRNAVQSVNIPDDIQYLVKMAGTGNVNLFCERW